MQIYKELKGCKNRTVRIGKEPKGSKNRTVRIGKEPKYSNNRIVRIGKEPNKVQRTEQYGLVKDLNMFKEQNSAEW